MKAAYLHVVADAVTSLTAIAALIGAMLWQIYWLDAVGALIGSFVITKWSVDLLRETGSTLIDLKKNS